MSQRDIQFPDKDKPLRRDVRDLGKEVGDLLKEQGGDSLFDAVEAARKASIRRREGDTSAEAELCQNLGDLETSLAHDVARAFDMYFQVVNLAEKVHRIRRGRHYLRQGAEPQKHSLHDLVRRLHRSGLDFDTVTGLLERLNLEPVFTAHPTQAIRRTLLEKRQGIARRLVDRLDPSMTPPEAKANRARIRAAITSAWQTNAHPSVRPSVSEERDGILFYVTDILYRIVPAFYQAFEDALEDVYGEVAVDYQVPQILRFASWVGGDMDGNPNVTAQSIAHTLRSQRHMVLALYKRDVLELAGHLSQTVPTRAAVSEVIEERVASYRALFPDTYEAIPRRHRDMPYRVLLRLMAARIEATDQDALGAYDDAEALLQDLSAIYDSLVANKGRLAGSFWVQRLRRRVQCFGFHLATLDVRQDAMVHRRAMADLLQRPDWLELNIETRCEHLQHALAHGVPAPGEAGGPEPDAVAMDGPAQDDLKRTLEVMRAIREGRQRFGAQAVGPHIISMTQGADDVLSLLLLARHGGLVDGDNVTLDIAPLFETVPDLQVAPDVMQTLLSNPIYARHLKQRGMKQIIMVGYSDSNKEGGIAASRWELQRGQTRLADTLTPAGVELTVFHGRGGTVGRGGGGRTHKSVMAAPSGSMNGHLRFTEQGESIDFQYGLRSIAMRTLERTTSAIALAVTRPTEPDPRLPRWHQLMAELAGASRAAYRGLIYEHEGFFAYFRHATPIDVIERMAIGSRPSSRRKQRGIEDLRAIPWVFSWSQSRHNLPGWFGLGQGLQEVIDRHGLDEIQVMAREWPFLHALLDDVASILAETDLAIAARYATLAPGGQAIHGRIQEHYTHTVNLLEQLQGSPLLHDNPTLKRAIRLRNPYVDPMSFLQVDLLRQWREQERPEGPLLDALLSTVQGIAQGLQGTG